MSEKSSKHGAGHDFAPNGRKLLWGNNIEKKKEDNNYETNRPIIQQSALQEQQIKPLNYILKPKSRGAQEIIKAAGDFKPPPLKRKISFFDTFYDDPLKYGKKPKLPAYLKPQEINIVGKVKRCTLHSYLECNDYSLSKNVCNVCTWFKEKKKTRKI